MIHYGCLDQYCYNNIAISWFCKRPLQYCSDPCGTPQYCIQDSLQHEKLATYSVYNMRIFF